MRAYYNENEPYAAAWLRNLIAAGHIPEGDVDERSIADVRPTDLWGYDQCHFFAGLGGWPLALRLAGWTAPVWTGSCPCQPFSTAGKREGFADPRHLFPEWFRLIRVTRPSTIFGEQVASTSVWLDEVFASLEGEGYACGAAILPAAGVDALHKRDRLWFVANADSGRWPSGNGKLSYPRHGHPASADGCDVSDAHGSHEQGLRRSLGASQEVSGSRGDSRWSVEPDVGRVAYGVPKRVGKLRALGNAIVPQVAAEFVRAFMDCRSLGLNVAN